MCGETSPPKNMRKSFKIISQPESEQHVKPAAQDLPAIPTREVQHS
jgi:hypothetical protein